MLNISVAMTSYNGEKYIKYQLESLLHQIRVPDEVVIIDDNSEDDTVNIIQSFIDDNSLSSWQLIVNKENLGFIKNFRKALSTVTGDVIFLCDQDDVWCEDKIESLSSVFAQHPEILSLNSSFTIIDAKGNDADSSARRKNNYGLIDKTIRRRLERIGLGSEFHRNISPGCTIAVRRELAENYVRLTRCELPHDYELNVMAAAKSGLYFYDAPLTKYRLHGDNTIGLDKKPRTRLDVADERISEARAVLDYAGKKGLYNLCVERKKALENKKLLGVLKLFLNKNYYRYFPFKERLGDILYTIKK